MSPTTLLSFPGLRGPTDYEETGYSSDGAVADDPIIYSVIAPQPTTKEPARARRVSFGSTEVRYFSESGSPDPIVTDYPPPTRTGTSTPTEILAPRPATRRVCRKTRPGLQSIPPSASQPIPSSYCPASMFYTLREEMAIIQASQKKKTSQEPRPVEEKGIFGWGPQWPCDEVFRQWAV